MKLERALAFFHSKKMGVEPGSKSFDLNEGDQNSAAYKLQNKKVKHGSTILRKNERGLDQSDCMAAPKLEFYNSAIDFNGDHIANMVDFVAPNSHSLKDKRGLDPSQNELQSAGRKAMPKLEFYDSMLDLKSQYEAQVMNLVEPVSNSSKDMESFMKFPNDKESVKKSAIKEIGAFRNSSDANVDNTVTEYESEMEVYYQGNTYHLVKEICVNGVLMKPSLIFEDSVGDNAYNCIPSLVFGSKEIPKNNTGNKGITLPTTEGSENISANHDQRNDLIHKDEDVRENHIGNTHEETELPEDTDDSIPPGDKDEQFSSEPEYVSKFLKPKKFLEEGLSAGPALGLAVEESEPEYVSKFLKPKKVPEEGVSAGPTLGLAVEESEPEYVSKFLKPKKVLEEGVSAGPALGLAVEESEPEYVSKFLKAKKVPEEGVSAGPALGLAVEESEPEYVSKFLKPKKVPEEGVSAGPALGLAVEESEPEYVSKFLKPKKVIEEGVSAGPALGLAVEESEPEYVSKFLNPKKVPEEGVSAGPALGLAVEESNSDGTRSLSYHFEPSALADCGKKDCHQLGVCNCNVTHHTCKPLEGHFVHGESSQIRNSLGEASFSALGPVSGRISYSGSIPYSGSISIRSDSSTTSTRSFAFPILQSEYVSSPVRMGQPEQKCCLRKQSSWKNRLLCCKF